MPELLEYKCPNCGGAIEFDSSIQKMKCPYCDTEFEMETLKAYDDVLKAAGEDNMDWETPDAEWREGETDGMRVYVCNSCGGEVIGDETLAATACPYCGNPIVMMGQFTGDLRPDTVIPFKLSKDDAKKRYLQHLEGKRLLPKIFRDENHIDEIRGIYVPFWLCDADADVNARYRTTRIRAWSDSRYNYTETSHFSVVRAGSIGFDGIPVDASTKMPDDLMESLEPFDASEAVDFQTAYLAGYLADRYDISSGESTERANARIKTSAENAFASTVTGYATVAPEGCSVNMKNGKAHYALLPVWILNTTYNNEKYVFAMNGQTGKFVGNLPLDKSAYKKWLFGLAFGIAAAVFGILSLFWFL